MANQAPTTHETYSLTSRTMPDLLLPIIAAIPDDWRLAEGTMVPAPLQSRHLPISANGILTLEATLYQGSRHYRDIPDTREKVARYEELPTKIVLLSSGTEVAHHVEPMPLIKGFVNSWIRNSYLPYGLTFARVRHGKGLADASASVTFSSVLDTSGGHASFSAVLRAYRNDAISASQIQSVIKACEEAGFGHTPSKKEFPSGVA